ncbi:hypothetical protein HHK36_019051 [Tetracentron sinense]|uniref:CCHC-type domain-containing protein n=1 Tax=Tetracentron sinense TaxID=13715 RepID=A0A834YWQ5_TETSI|nr:hypothetical protein HHK36_019051 [Tetracentron sinense]
MSSDKSDPFLVRFNGKNYSAWAFHFKIFVKGKDLWGHVDGSNPAPDKNKDKDQPAKWEVKDAQIMAWILGSVESNIILNLRPSKTAAEMWTYLKKLYSQHNTARWFQLEYDLANLQQDNLSISDFYTSFMNLWVEYTDIVYATLPPEGRSSVQSVHETTKRDQFLKKLRSEFEGTRSTSVPVAYAAQGKPRGRDMSTVQCFCCKGFGHFASNCPKKFCNYCKKDGHIIKESTLTQSAPVQPVTPEMIQQMIISAFSALRLSATGDVSPSLTNVFVSPGLTTNLVSVGQLVDNDCKVEFTKSGCVVQDQQSGKMIARGPKEFNASCVDELEVKLKEDGWPLGLQPLNMRVGLVRDRDFSGSMSFNTLLTGSPSSSSDSSSDLDTESTGSFFHDKSITLGSLIGVSNILELPGRSVRGKRAEALRGKKSYRSKTWFFSLCSKASEDVKSMNNPPSLGHFLEAERRAVNNYRWSESPIIYEPDEFAQARPLSESNSLFINDRIAPPRSSPWIGSDAGRGPGEGLDHGNGYGVPVLLSCMCGQPTH